MIYLLKKAMVNYTKSLKLQFWLLQHDIYGQLTSPTYFIVCRRFEFPFYRQAQSLYGQTLFFFPNLPPLWTIIFDDISLMK